MNMDCYERLLRCISKWSRQFAGIWYNVSMVAF